MNAACKNSNLEAAEHYLTMPDIAIVPDPKPARVCVSNVVLGRGAKVSFDSDEPLGHRLKRIGY
jgi:hypothetical protein